MKKQSVIITSICVAGLALCAPVTVSAQFRQASPSPTASASPDASATASSKPIGFHGTISAVDQNAKTFTIAGKKTSRVFKVTDKTVIMKDGNPATMADIAENEKVTGSYWKSADGSLEAKTVTLGAKSEKSKKKSKKDEASASPSATP